MFQVFENDKPADCFAYKVDKSWDTSIFDKWENAVEYAKNWLGSSYSGFEFIPNVAHDYGYGSTITIKEI